MNENLSGMSRYGAGGTTPDEYGKRGGQDVKRGVANHTPIITAPGLLSPATNKESAGSIPARLSRLGRKGGGSIP